MDKITLKEVEQIVKIMAEVAIKNKAYFSELDGVMGDADFGDSLSNGFKAVIDGWESYDRRSIKTFLLNISTVIIANTGGCSGPIWGTLFMRSGVAANDKTELGLNDMVLMLRSAMDGIMSRGGAKLGDKTLLDAITPIIDVFERFSSKNEPIDISAAFVAAADAASEAAENAKGWVAKRGRQSFTGDRSAGTLDPGMVAIAKMMKAISQSIQNQ